MNPPATDSSDFPNRFLLSCGKLLLRKLGLSNPYEPIGILLKREAAGEQEVFAEILTNLQPE